MTIYRATPNSQDYWPADVVRATSQAKNELNNMPNKAGLLSAMLRCDNCQKRGPWELQRGSKHVADYELATCNHRPLPAQWNGTTLWVAHGCGGKCAVWELADA